MKKVSFFTLLILSISIISHGKDPFQADSKLGFIQNKGQIKNQYKHVNTEVKYLFDTQNGMNVQLRKNGLSYDTYRELDEKIHIHRLDMNLSGANFHSKLHPNKELPGVSNHYVNGKALAENVKSFEEVNYINVYDGVDFVVSVTDAGQVKYDFVIAHAHQANQILLQYKGFDSFKIENNELIFDLSGLTLVESIPASWTSSDGKPLEVKYFIVSQSENEVELGVHIQCDIDPTAAIVIDPLAVLEWGTYYGGNLADVGNAIATDSLGNVFAVGTTHSMYGFASEGSYQSVFAGGNTDAYLVKFNQHGLRHWATYYGGSGDDEGLNVDLDWYENIYIVGRTNSTDSIGTEGAHQPIHGGGSDGFIARFNRFGNLIWDSYIGGIGEDVATSCHTDNRGNVAVVGYTNTGGFLQNDSITPSVSYQSGLDGFLAWFNSDGSLTQSRFVGGEGDDQLTGIELDSLGSVILVGNTNSISNISFSSSYQSTLGGSQDAFIMKIDTSNVLLWSSYFGGDSLETATGIESVGDTLFISGNIKSHISYTDTLDNQHELGGNTDGYLLSLTGDGALNWFTYLGAENDDFANGISKDYAGMLYVIGTSISDSIMGSEESHLQFGQGEEDAYVVKFSKMGMRQWSTYHGGSAADFGNDIAVYGFTSVYITGLTHSFENIALDGPEQQSFQFIPSTDFEEAFMARFTQERSTMPIGIGQYGNGNSQGEGSQPAPIGICHGDSIHLSVNGGALGYLSQWVWYEGGCGGIDNFIGEGTSIWVSPDSTTSYYVRSENVDELGNCSSVTVHVDYQNTVVASDPDPVCPGESAQFNAEGGFSYAWTGPDEFTRMVQNPVLDTALLINEGVYQVIAFTQFGCSDTTEVELSLLPSPSFNIESVDPTCFGDQDGSITLSSQNDSIQYFWPGLGVDSNHVAGLTAGTYFLIASNQYGCAIQDSVVINQAQELIKELIITPAYCDQANGTARIEVASTVDYIVDWQPINTDGDELTNLAAGDYTVTVSNELGCTETSSFTILNIDNFTAIIEPDSLFLDWWSTVEVSAYASPDTVDNTYQWWPTDGVSCSNCATTILDPDTSTTFYVEITSQNGCSSIDSVFVDRELPTPTAFVPTVFSPNNDGLNDELCVKGTRLISFQLKVYNRYGVEVFSSNSVDKCWDGSINGVPQTGSFVFTMDAILEDDMTHRETGNITIKR